MLLDNVQGKSPQNELTALVALIIRTQFYNLDAILSVGYRVNSKRGTQLRQWATKVLRDHLVQGFTVNQPRIAEKGLSEMQQAVELLARTLNNQTLVNEVGRDVLSVIGGYAKKWRIPELPVVTVG